MNLLDTHIHRLVFQIDNDAPEEYMDRWNNFKLKCEYPTKSIYHNKDIFEYIKKKL